MKHDSTKYQDIVGIQALVVGILQPSSQNGEEGRNGSAHPDTDL